MKSSAQPWTESVGHGRGIYEVPLHRYPSSSVGYGDDEDKPCRDWSTGLPLCAPLRVAATMRLRYRPPADAFAAASERSEAAYSSACLPRPALSSEDDAHSEGSAFGGVCLARHVLDATAPQPCKAEVVMESRPQAAFQSAMAKARNSAAATISRATHAAGCPFYARRRGSCCGRGAFQRALRGVPLPPAGLLAPGADAPGF